MRQQFQKTPSKVEVFLYTPSLLPVIVISSPNPNTLPSLGHSLENSTPELQRHQKELLLNNSILIEEKPEIRRRKYHSKDSSKKEKRMEKNKCKKGQYSKLVVLSRILGYKMDRKTKRMSFYVEFKNAATHTVMEKVVMDEQTILEEYPQQAAEYLQRLPEVRPIKIQ